MITPDWDPRSEDVRRDQRAAYDGLRARCPVAYSDFMGWSVFRHADGLRVLHDHETFSNVVSRHLSVPNGMDPPEHTAFRPIIERYFQPERLRPLEPACRAIIAELLSPRPSIELVAEVALPFTARVQCAFLDAPADLAQPLVRWAQQNHAATLAQDRAAQATIAQEFEDLIDALCDRRADLAAGTDVISSLMREEVCGRPLTRREIASILRNWTVGEIGTISASISIIVEFLATHAAWQARLRSDPALLMDAIDEILRLHGPLVANRRVATRAVELGGRRVEAGEPLSLNWVSANRDERVFDHADEFRLDRDPSLNLLFGAGIHVCPGYAFARLELRVFTEELLARTADIRLDPAQPPTVARYPASGFATLPVLIDWAAA